MYRSGEGALRDLEPGFMAGGNKVALRSSCLLLIWTSGTSSIKTINRILYYYTSSYTVLYVHLCYVRNALYSVDEDRVDAIARRTPLCDISRSAAHPLQCLLSYSSATGSRLFLHPITTIIDETYDDVNT